ncbi:MAG: mechanosensitive ion channel family protein, partial [Sphingobacteriaceae bacterium]|nr:mechanosensitive ion channel family protein [Cytophagaceae bacterium]
MMNAIAMVELIWQRLETWAKLAVSHLPNLAVALLVIFLANFLAGIVRRLTTRSLNRVSDNPSLADLSGLVARALVLATGVFIAPGILGLDKTVTSLLAGAGVLALAIGFAFQDLTANFISGTFIAIQRPIQVGDLVETNGYTGRVVSIKLRSILLDNFAGQLIEIPSKDVFQKPIVNFTRTGERRMELLCSVSYADDLDRAQRVAIEAVGRLPFLRRGRDVEMHYRNFGDNTIGFLLWFWIDPTKTNPTLALSEAIKAVKTAFDEAEILILFPPHTLDLKQRLAEE